MQKNMEMLLNHIDLIANIVVCGLFLMLGFFISTVLAEKRHFKRQEKQMKEDLLVAKTSVHSEEDLAELERLRAEVAANLEAVKRKDLEMEKLIDQMNQLTEEHRKLAVQLSESPSDKGEVTRLRSGADANQEAIKQKDHEIGKLMDQLNQLNEEHRKLAAQASESPNDKGEITRLRSEADANQEAIKQKDHEIEKLIDQLNQLNENYRRQEPQRSESSADKGELERLRSEILVKTEEVAAKERELAKLRDEKRLTEEKVVKAEKILEEYEKFEKTISEQRRSAHDVEQRISEMKIKLRVLSEKAKENVELIAAFAGAKEFDEFRKSIHLDELTRKYEYEIKDIDNKKE